MVKTRVRDPDPYICGPSGSASRKYGSGSFPFLINVLSGLNNGCKIQVLIFMKIKVTEDFSTNPHPDLLHRYGYEDPRPNPYQNVTDPEHWFFYHSCL
jgi:hypothetical protein